MNKYVKKQHYYPRGLLKHFSDGKRVFIYNREADSFNWKNYESICYHNYMYETKGEIDNILENRLSSYENRVIPIIDKIISEILSGKTPSIVDKDVDLLWDYMWIQTPRTDAGRIMLMNNIYDPSDEERKQPVDLIEIKTESNKRNKFNEIYKKDGALEALLRITKRPQNMIFHVALCVEEIECFITSDNPVMFLNGEKDHDDFQMIMPIHPNICIEFQRKNSSPSDGAVLRMTTEKIRFINRAQINTANYFVIADRKFDVALTFYILNRFRNPEWKLT